MPCLLLCRQWGLLGWAVAGSTHVNCNRQSRVGSTQNQYWGLCACMSKLLKTPYYRSSSHTLCIKAPLGANKSSLETLLVRFGCLQPEKESIQDKQLLHKGRSRKSDPRCTTATTPYSICCKRPSAIVPGAFIVLGDGPNKKGLGGKTPTCKVEAQQRNNPMARQFIIYHWMGKHCEQTHKTTVRDEAKVDRNGHSKTPQNQQKCIQKGSTFAKYFYLFLQIATPVLSFANFLQLLSFVE